MPEKPKSSRPFVAFLIGFFVLCTLPVLAMPVAGSATSSEGRNLSTLPQLIEDGVWNEEFGTEFETYLGEHFAWREQLVTLHAQLVSALTGTSAESKVIVGREGWLFYTPTKNDFLGTDPMTARERFAVGKTVALMQEYVEGRGGKFVFTVAPNKNSLYGQYMPYFDVPANPENELVPVAATLQAAGVHYVDLYALLKQNLAAEQLYYKRDSHWNEAGARLAYGALMAAADQPFDPFAEATHTLVYDRRGDLDRLLYPKAGVQDARVELSVNVNELYRYKGPGNVELAKVVTNAPAGTGSLLMFRDSFGNALLPYVATAFADATFLKATPFAPAQMQDGQTVIVEIVQRNLPTLLDAAPAMPAPARDAALLQGAQVTPHTDACQMDLQYKDGTAVVCGVLDPALVPDEAALYVAVVQGGESTLYEAFPVRETALYGENGAGCGFSLQIPGLSEADLAALQPFTTVYPVVAAPDGAAPLAIQ